MEKSRKEIKKKVKDKYYEKIRLDRLDKFYKIIYKKVVRERAYCPKCEKLLKGSGSYTNPYKCLNCNIWWKHADWTYPYFYGIELNSMLPINGTNLTRYGE